MVIRETASTQDLARERGPTAGDVVAAWRQTGGRGRLGRRWSDTGEEGVAVTFVVEAPAPELLAAILAVAACEAVESVLQAGSPRPGIKWPNDLWVDGRKLAGILVEQQGALAACGIGVNVRQRSFEPGLATRATSLAMMSPHTAPDRLEVLVALVGAVDRWLGRAPEEICAAYAARDLLRGARARLQGPEGAREGTVEAVDPLRGIRIRDDAGVLHHLPAATTSVEWFRGRGGAGTQAARPT
ncbi:MAG: biotin--[acetyl-CoA-carboxylase] ligase [Phycisphaerales bacterium]